MHRFSHLELSVRTGNAHNSLVADDLRSDHSHCLTLCGVDLAGHDTAAGLVLRELQLAKTTPWARAQVPNVVGDLHEGDGDDVESTVCLNEGVMGGECLELVRRRLELNASEGGDLPCDGDVEALLGVEAGADGGAALREEREARDDVAHARDAVLDLRDVARELLAERERRRVLHTAVAVSP